MAGPVDGDKAPQDARFPTALVYAANTRNTYRSPEEPRDFGSVVVMRKMFTPNINGFGPRTINRGPTPGPTVGTSTVGSTGGHPRAPIPREGGH